MAKKHERQTYSDIVLISSILIIVIAAIAISALDYYFSNTAGEARRGGGNTNPPAPDVTQYIELLGNPAMSQYPDNPMARTPWDMQVYGNRIYLGQGDVNNNVGSYVAPVAVWYYDTATEKFVKEYEVDDEEINLYRVFDTLYIPGLDARGSGCNFYRIESDQWKKYNMPSCQHMLNIEKFKDILFNTNSGIVRVSFDGGMKWDYATGITNGKYGSAFFVLGDNLYIQLLAFGGKEYIYRYKGGNEFEPIAGTMVPKASSKYMSPRIVYYKGKIVYPVGGSELAGDNAYYDGVYVASTLSDVYKTSMPTSDFIWDVIKAKDKNGVEAVYVLTSMGISAKGATSNAAYFVNKVYMSTDLKTWTPVFQFTTPSNYVKSFESYNGDFYFGLGVGNWYPNVGNILRLKSDFVP